MGLFVVADICIARAGRRKAFTVAIVLFDNDSLLNIHDAVAILTIEPLSMSACDVL